MLCRRDKAKIKIIVFIFGAIIISSALWYGRAFSYNDTITHPSLTGNIAKVYNANFAQKLTDQEINWLKLGSIEEDTPPRWLNHFYDPNTDQGLWGNFSSKQWAQDSWVQALALGGNQTWQKAIESYVKNDKKAAFVALGHILHLLEDATVPAHTRLDAHPEGDPYESWVFENKKENIDFSSLDTKPIKLNTLNDLFDALASYSSNNFLSKDTIIDKDKLSSFISFKKVFNDKLYECIKGSQGQCLALIKEDISGKEYFLDNPVHSDYFSLLGPKAVAYGAGTIKLFFDEAEKIKKEEENKSWWQKLKEKADGWVASVSGSLYTGSSVGLIDNLTLGSNSSEDNNSAPSEAPSAAADGTSEAPGVNPSPGNIGIGQYSLPANTVTAQNKITLPPSTVMAQEKLGGDIVEEITPDDVDIPPAIVEEINPSQVTLPKPSPSPLKFLFGSDSAPSPSPSPDSDVDTTPPQTTITSAPDSTVATTTAIFEFNSSESDSTFSCQLDGATSTVCVSPKKYTNLFAGDHTFKVSAKDASGNEDAIPASHAWSINVALDTIITSAPAANVHATTTTFIFNSTYASSTFSCKLDSSVWLPCVSPKKYSDLIEGSHQFKVVAIDVAGNQDLTPATHDWHIDPPMETFINDVLFGEIGGASIIFSFESFEIDVTYECELDNATSTCVSPKEYTNLAEGDHVFKVTATDTFGDKDTFPGRYSWTVDLTPPNLSNISSAPGRTSAVISWTSNEAGIFQLEYGTSTSYGFLSATTSLARLNLSSLTLVTMYHYRLLAKDSLNNATTTGDYSFETSNQAANVVISEVQVGGATATDEFVELRNTTAADINLTGWRLTRKSATGSTVSNLLTTFPNKIIPAKGYFLIAHPTGYDGGVPADAVYSTTSSLAEKNNTLILYSDAGDTVVDLVGFGSAVNSETATIANPPDNQSVERKAFNNSTSTTMFNGSDKWQGNNYDSDNNSQDFVLQNNTAPQNSLMLSEPRSSLPNISTASAWPVWQKNLKRTGLLSTTSLASSTMNVKWTATSTEVFSTTPVLDGSGNIYIGRNDGLAKYSSSGALQWLYATSSSHSTPLILDDDSVVFRGDGGLFSVDSQGRQRWKYYLDGGSGRYSPPVILSDGTLITVSITDSIIKIYAINQDATLKWVFDSGWALGNSDNFTAPVVDASDNIIIAIDKYIYKISPAGNLLWEQTLGNFYSSLALGADNTLYFSVVKFIADFGYAGEFYALNSDGSVKWSDSIIFNDHARLAPVVDSAGNIYVITIVADTSKLSMFNSSGTLGWSINLASTNLAAPILTSDGKIYFIDQKTLKIFNASDGALLASFNASDNGDLYTYFGAVGSNGTIYTANQYTLYTIDD